MKSDQILKRISATLICLLAVNMVLSAFPPHPLAISACAAGEGRQSRPATPSGIPEYPEEDGILWEDEILLDDVPAASPEATPSDATPSNATPSDASRRIIFVDVPALAVLEAGEADDNTWQDMLPQQALSWTESSGELWCELQWSVPQGNWDQPGLYPAEIEVIPPDGYRIDEKDRFCDAVVSVRPPGTFQVMEVFTFMRYGMKGHTWTFAMKAGQDMAPLVETLEKMTLFSGLLDDPSCNISFLAEWDFSSVDPTRPGIHPIHRTLTLMEESLPEGIRPEDIYLPDYWKDLPVLFTVEEPEGPQLYGVLESPYDFFGSYARLSEEELAALEVWYSIDGGRWTLQTDETLMYTYEANFSINKEAMAKGSRYSFRLKLGDHVSRELTVPGDGTPPVWFTSMMDGNRDGTIDVEFPNVSQPPPTEPTEEGKDPEPTKPSGEDTNLRPTKPDEGDTNPRPTKPDEGEANPTPTKPDEGEANPQPTKPDEGEANPTPAESGEGDADLMPTETAKADSNLIPTETVKADSNLIPTETVKEVVNSQPTKLTEGEANSDIGNSGNSRQPEPSQAASQGNLPPTASYPGEGTEPAQEAAINKIPGSLPIPEEAVTRWSTQISGKRVRKLLELYPDWIRFQKEDVAILLSSQWLKEQNMRDSDVLTVSVSPGEDRTVTILINQKTPQTPPVCQITIGETKKGRSGGMGAAERTILVLVAACAMFVPFWRRRCGK